MEHQGNYSLTTKNLLLVIYRGPLKILCFAGTEGNLLSLLPAQSKLWWRFEVVSFTASNPLLKCYKFPCGPIATSTSGAGDLWGHLFTTQSVGPHLDGSIFKEVIVGNYDPTLQEALLGMNLPWGALKLGSCDRMARFLLQGPLVLSHQAGINRNLSICSNVFIIPHPFFLLFLYYFFSLMQYQILIQKSQECLKVLLVFVVTANWL